MKNKRLDKIELQLTPRQFAIRLADQLRSYHSCEDLLKASARGTYREFPFVAPFYLLAQQAENRYPGREPEVVHKRIELNRKLRLEFHALKTVINKINNEIQVIAEMSRLKVAAQLSAFHTLILKDILAHISAAPETSASHARLSHCSLLEGWADKTAMLFLETIASKRAVQIVQEKYFESHSILHKDIEVEFEITIRTIREAITLFNEYGNEMAQGSVGEFDREQHTARTRIGVTAIEERAEMLVDSIAEKWVNNARTKATADILRESGTHEEYIWEDLRKRVGLNSHMRGK